jgi:hypothetical protein
MKKVNEYIIKPFRLGEVSIDAIWIDGKPYFSTDVIYNTFFREYMDVEVSEEMAIENCKEIEVSDPLSKEGKKEMKVFDLTGLILLVVGHPVEPAIKFRQEIARFIEKHWEDVPEEEG